MKMSTVTPDRSTLMSNNSIHGPNTTVNHTGNFASREFLSAEAMIVLYSIIFLLSLSGNILVILTLTRIRKMRTITNLFLLNLSISDLLLSVLCMPFSLVALLLKDFIFGEPMCILVRYFQGRSPIHVTYFNPYHNENLPMQ